MAERYSIKQVAEQTGLSQHMLRYYERMGLIGDVERLPNSHRRYSQANIAWIEFLKYLRKTGMSVRQMQRYAELTRQGDASMEERGALLREHRDHVKAQLEDVQQNLAFIEKKIAWYEEELSRHNGRKKEKA